MSRRYAVIGGLGAVAGADILHRVVKSTPAKSDSEHLDISFTQRPFSEDITPASSDYDPTKRKFYVYDTLKDMESAGQNVALLPCFVSQTFLHEIQPEINVQVLSIIDSLNAYIRKHHNSGRIGVLTSIYVRDSKLFENTLGDVYEVIYPSEPNQSRLMEAIYGEHGIKAGCFNQHVENLILEVCTNLAEQQVGIILPGFTDIPTMLEKIANQIPVPILNSNQIYADYAVTYAAAYKNTTFKIGVVGGIGPAATTDFMSKVIKNTSASRDQDHIKMIVEQNPQIPDRTENLLSDGDDPTIALYSCCKKLEQGGANIIAIPCNTAHAYVSRIQQYLLVPIINMLDETIEYIVNHFPQTKRVGLLATTGTVKSLLYQTAAERAGLILLVPDEAMQSQVMIAIYGEKGVKAGYTSGHCKELLLDAYEYLEKNGAEVIILGCTELPLIAPKLEDPSRPAELDPTDILARKCVKISRSR